MTSDIRACKLTCPLKRAETFEVAEASLDLNTFSLTLRLAS